MLMLEDIVIRLRDRELLRVDGMVAPDAPLTIMGPSGSGKSSLFAFLAGFLDPVFEASGRACIGSTVLTDLPAEARRMGLLFQDPLLFPHMSVGGNLLFALPAGGTRTERRAAAEAALAQAGLDGFFARDPETLSGGQKARVALMRVLLSRPRALLLDEPFSKLDAGLRREMRDLVFARARAEHLPTVLVTHDEADAEAAGGPVLRVGG